MRRGLIMFIALAISISVFSQTQLPKKLTKGLDVTVDEFNGGIKYSSKMTGLEVISKKDVCDFTWTLNCSDFVPISFSKVQVLVNGKVEEIEFNQEEYKEYAETIRVPQNTFAGGRMATTFVNQDRYIAEIKIDASKCTRILEEIIEDKRNVKIRFSGNKDVDGEFGKKKKKEMETILNVYRTIIN